MSLFGNAQEIQLKVEGMHCPKCVARVKEALENVDGVASAEVILEPGSATVTGTADADALIAAIEAIEFKASLA